MGGGADIYPIVKGPKETFLGLAEKGVLTCRESSAKVFLQSFIAGCYIGFGALLAVSISAAMPGLTASNPGLKTAIFAFLFPVNLVLIMLTGGILFTGTSAAAPAAFYEGKARAVDVLRVLVLSWWGNVLGSLLFSAFTVWCELNGGTTGQFLAEIATKKTSKGFDVTFAKGIGCNWMVCMAVFLSGMAQDFTGKCVAIYLPISTFVMIGFEHIPANFYLLCMALLNGDISFVDVLVKNWIPTTLGNFASGALIVALGYSYLFGRLGGNLPRDEKTLNKDARKSMGMDAIADELGLQVEEHDGCSGVLTADDVDIKLVAEELDASIEMKAPGTAPQLPAREEPAKEKQEVKVDAEEHAEFKQTTKLSL